MDKKKKKEVGGWEQDHGSGNPTPPLKKKQV